MYPMMPDTPSEDNWDYNNEWDRTEPNEIEIDPQYGSLDRVYY